MRRKTFLISQCSLLYCFFFFFFFSAFLGGRKTYEGSRTGKLKIISCFQTKMSLCLKNTNWKEVFGSYQTKCLNCPRTELLFLLILFSEVLLRTAII